MTSTAEAPVAAPAGRTAAAPSRKASRRGLAKAGVLLRRTVALAAFLAVWELAPRAGLVDRIFLPPVSEIAPALWDLAGSGRLWQDAEASLVRSLSGFGLSIAVAVPLGLLIGWYRPVAELLNPLLELFRNTAAIALLPVFVLILGIGETSKVAIVLYACTWPILLNTISAVGTVDPTLVKSARSLGLSAPRIFQKVILPAAVPTVFTGIRLAGATAVLVVIVAEMVGAKEGLGFLINSSQQNFAIDDMYAGIIAISALGLLFNHLLVLVERRFTRWRAPVR
ncbi:ABC transporter permease [Actinomadura decatromicini]|uniref:ABC transporter permease n=1 Tax=Actinomadura decatromicini TaxID=2604572 RepID=A0A5D3FMP2_9ACTN|nr:ABC transporter permease [Actinomadura decatromicini]TYK49186.1 ABC transporter permease [Actinomadura decatromicini]